MGLPYGARHCPGGQPGLGNLFFRKRLGRSAGDLWLHQSTVEVINDVSVSQTDAGT